MAASTLEAGQVESARIVAGMATLGTLISVYGSLVIIDALVAAMGFSSVPFDVGPPMPRNWFPNVLVGLSITGCGFIARLSACKKNLSWAAMLGLFLALGAVYEIVLLDKLYAYEGRPALSATGGVNSLQDRLDRAYSSTLRVQIPAR